VPAVAEQERRRQPPRRIAVQFRHPEPRLRQPGQRRNRNRCRRCGRGRRLRVRSLPRPTVPVRQPPDLVVGRRRHRSRSRPNPAQDRGIIYCILPVSRPPAEARAPGIKHSSGGRTPRCRAGARPAPAVQNHRPSCLYVVQRAEGRRRVGAWVGQDACVLTGDTAELRKARGAYSPRRWSMLQPGCTA